MGLTATPPGRRSSSARWSSTSPIVRPWTNSRDPSPASVLTAPAGQPLGRFVGKDAKLTGRLNHYLPDGV
jgi:hypothetical protein